MMNEGVEGTEFQVPSFRFHLLGLRGSYLDLLYTPSQNPHSKEQIRLRLYAVLGATPRPLHEGCGLRRARELGPDHLVFVGPVPSCAMSPH